MNTSQQKAKTWLSAENLDAETKNKIEILLSGSQNELDEAFLNDLAFGTGGLRGIMGVGSSRINKYTIGKATQGFSNYLKNTQTGQIKVAIAHDSRNNSREFAEITASVFSANGIQVYLFEDLRPTPELSFAIRELDCNGGVVLTASHNPKEYNGYKAYWSDGGQLISPHDKNVIEEVNKITNIDNIQFTADTNLIQKIGADLDEKYFDMVSDLSLSPESIKKHHDLKIVYSSIHGSGIQLVPKALEKIGFTNVHTVEEQEEPNGNFPTVVYPNPEEQEAMTLTLKKATAIDADIAMATDPDADRVGIAVKNSKGEFQLLNGNQTGAILVYYLLKKHSEKGLKGNEFITKTIVTTELIKDIADSFGIKSYDTLTGFKYIAALIQELEGKEQFIGGGEESYGYLVGDKVRDKDAVISCVMLAEATAWAKEQSKTLFDILLEIYNQHGVYQEDLYSIKKEGLKGKEEIQKMMENFRNNPPSKLGDSPVTKVIDYLSGESKTEKGIEKIDLPKSNVLQYITESGTKVSIRPSGTEPKIKFYFSVKTDNKDNNGFFVVQKALFTEISTIKTHLNI